MAGFRTHIAVSSMLGVGYAGVLHTMYGVSIPTAAVAGTLCGVAGMLPDLDSDGGIPLREVMSFAAATAPILFINRLESLELKRNEIVLISIGLYLFVRFGVAGMIRKFTVHRGMFHSIPAVLIFGGITYLLTGGRPAYERYVMAGGVMAGALSHLLLDEIYSIEFSSGRWRTKKSFGTALKFWGGSSKSTMAAYAKLAVVGAGVVGEPGALKNFIANRPQISEAINIVTQIGQSDPRFAGQFEQLRNILGTLNTNQDDSEFPSSGEPWSSTVAQQQNNNPFGNQLGNPPSSLPPANGFTNNQQFSNSQQLPPQQFQPVAPVNNQRPDWQWPTANQPSNNNQSAQFPNGINTARRPFGQYPQ